MPPEVFENLNQYSFAQPESIYAFGAPTNEDEYQQQLDAFNQASAAGSSSDYLSDMELFEDELTEDPSISSLDNESVDEEDLLDPDSDEETANSSSAEKDDPFSIDGTSADATPAFTGGASKIVPLTLAGSPADGLAKVIADENKPGDPAAAVDATTGKVVDEKLKAADEKKSVDAATAAAATTDKAVDEKLKVNDKVVKEADPAAPVVAATGKAANEKLKAADEKKSVDAATAVAATTDKAVDKKLKVNDKVVKEADPAAPVVAATGKAADEKLKAADEKKSVDAATAAAATTDKVVKEADPAAPVVAATGKAADEKLKAADEKKSVDAATAAAATTDKVVKEADPAAPVVAATGKAADEKLKAADEKKGVDAATAVAATTDKVVKEADPAAPVVAATGEAADEKLKTADEKKGVDAATAVYEKTGQVVDEKLNGKEKVDPAGRDGKINDPATETTGKDREKRGTGDVDKASDASGEVRVENKGKSDSGREPEAKTRQPAEVKGNDVKKDTLTASSESDNGKCKDKDNSSSGNSSHESDNGKDKDKSGSGNSNTSSATTNQKPQDNVSYNPTPANCENKSTNAPELKREQPKTAEADVKANDYKKDDNKPAPTYEGKPDGSKIATDQNGRVVEATDTKDNTFRYKHNESEQQQNQPDVPEKDKSALVAVSDKDGKDLYHVEKSPDNTAQWKDRDNQPVNKVEISESGFPKVTDKQGNQHEHKPDGSVSVTRPEDRVTEIQKESARLAQSAVQCNNKAETSSGTGQQQFNLVKEPIDRQSAAIDIVPFKALQQNSHNNSASLVSIHDIKPVIQDGRVVLTTPDGTSLIKSDGKPLSAMELGSVLRHDGTLVVTGDGQPVSAKDLSQLTHEQVKALINAIAPELRNAFLSSLYPEQAMALKFSQRTGGSLTETNNSKHFDPSARPAGVSSFRSEDSPRSEGQRRSNSSFAPTSFDPATANVRNTTQIGDSKTANSEFVVGSSKSSGLISDSSKSNTATADVSLQTKAPVYVSGSNSARIDESARPARTAGKEDAGLGFYTAEITAKQKDFANNGGSISLSVSASNRARSVDSADDDLHKKEVPVDDADLQKEVLSQGQSAVLNQQAGGQQGSLGGMQTGSPQTGNPGGTDPDQSIYDASVQDQESLRARSETDPEQSICNASGRFGAKVEGYISGGKNELPDMEAVFERDIVEPSLKIARLAVSHDSSVADSNYYRVRLGDTLRSIALKRLGDTSEWRTIAEQNGLSTDVDTYGLPIASLSKGMSLFLPHQL